MIKPDRDLMPTAHKTSALLNGSRREIPSWSFILTILLSSLIFSTMKVEIWSWIWIRVFVICTASQVDSDNWLFHINNIKLKVNVIFIFNFMQILNYNHFSKNVISIILFCNINIITCFERNTHSKLNLLSFKKCMHLSSCLTNNIFVSKVSYRNYRMIMVFWKLKAFDLCHNHCGLLKCRKCQYFT